MKRKTASLNDGYAECYKKADRETDFSAAISAKSLSDLEFIVSLAYSEETRREQDYEFADSKDRSLNLKIKTLLYQNVTSDVAVKIGDMLYSIIKLDYDKKNQVMYFYLEEDRKIAE